MTPVFLGLGTALCWGGADFSARFLGRAIGALPALAAVTLFGAVELSLVMIVRGEGLPSLADASSWAWMAAVATVVAMWMLYEALLRAPMAVVAPLVGAYPAWSLLIGVAVLGVRPSAETWAAMVAVLLGMWLVAGHGPAADDTLKRGAILLAFCSGLLFGVAVLMAQPATALHGSLNTVWYNRVFASGLLMLTLVALSARRRPCLPWRWTAVAAGQGMLDTGGYVFLFAAAPGLDATIATVVSSTFGAFAILLARVFLGERIGHKQTAGMGLVFGGVAYLSWTG